MKNTIDSFVTKITEASAKLGIINGKETTISLISNEWDEWRKQPVVFTYKKHSFDERNYLYDVYLNGKFYDQYSSPVEKVIVIIVESLKKSYLRGGNDLMLDMLKSIREDENKEYGY